MGRKSEYSKELKIKTVKRYLGHEASFKQLADDLGAGIETIRGWVMKYQVYGESAFDEKPHNAAYTAAFKKEVVQAYLNGEGSASDLALKYGIPADGTVQKWVKDYNSHRELRDYIPGKKDIYMTKKCRETTLEERIEIVEYCLDHDKNFRITAERYDVTYSNVYNWVKKYTEKGEDGLRDRRGHHKEVNEDKLDEYTKLLKENAKLKRKLEIAELENRLLKKVSEVERRRSAEKAAMKQNISRSKKRRKKKRK